MWKVQAGARLDTFLAVIRFNGEYRVLPES